MGSNPIVGTLDRRGFVHLSQMVRPLQNVGSNPTVNTLLMLYLSYSKSFRKRNSTSRHTLFMKKTQR